MDNILTIPAQPVNGQRGTTDTAILVRFKDGATVAVGVEVGRTASEYLEPYNTDVSVVVGVRQRGVTVDLLAEPVDLLREAQRRLSSDAILRYRSELTAKVMNRLRTDDIKSRPRAGLEDDRVIAAIALVVATLPLPGAQRGQSSEMG